MYGAYLIAYSAFLFLVFLFFLANSLIPRRKESYSTGKRYRPKVLVMVPCKGFDIDIEGNLRAAGKQDYGNYDIVAVVASRGDSALRSIRATGTPFMVVKPRGGNSSGKVSSLAGAMSRLKDYDVYVILDSDVLVRSDWLRLLIAPLSDDHIGISTAFPVFKPITNGFWAKVKHTWGFVGQGLMENRITRFGWGGSLAFRKDLMSRKDFGYFADSISDDIAITRIASRKGLGFAYVPEANPVVRSNDTFGKFSEWANRQTAFSIAGSRKILYYGLIYYSMWLLLLASSIVLGVTESPAFFAFLIPFAVGAFKLYQRSDESYMLWMYFAINMVYLCNLAVAGARKTVKWRGRTYDLAKIRKSTDAYAAT